MKLKNRKRPNILFITCDQWRGDCVSAAGHPVVKTPNVDALAKEGVLFKRHYAGAAPCAPARACIYTGLYQMNNRVCRNGTPLDTRHGNVALAARALGYDPTLFGYTDVGPDPRRYAPNDPILKSYEGVLPGFTVRQLLPEHQKQWLSWLTLRGVDASAGSPGIHRPADRKAAEVSTAPPVYGADETPTAFLAGEFIRWLGEQDDRTPWFAHLSFISPHPPFIVPAPFNTMYDPADGPAMRRGDGLKAHLKTHPFLAWALPRPKKDKFLPGAKGRVTDFSEDEFRVIRAIYWGMVSEVDAQLGRIWQALKDAGDWDDTVVVLTGDHAEMMGDHFMLGKGGFYDESYHVPLVVRDPRRRKSAGTTVDAFTEAVDLMPTLVEAMGGAPPQHLDGRSLRPFLDRETPAGWRDCAHWEFDFRGSGKSAGEEHFGLKPQQCTLTVLRGRDLKYVHFGGGLPPLLFDLAEDPAELRNVADEPSYLGRRLEMAERLLAWRAEHLDQSLALVELTDEGAKGFVPPHPL